MKPVRIFISSPGDVAAEREKARVVIAELQKRYTGTLLLQPVFWEDLALGSSNSFQGGIDVILSSERGIDIAVFILWSRLGSPLGTRILKEDGSEYRSGTEREWDLMLRARERSGGVRPDLFTYIREDEHGIIEAHRGKELPALRDMVDQRGKVQDFIKEQFTDRETGANTRAYFPFREPITFAHRLRTHLRARLDEMLVDADGAAVVWHPAEQGSPFRGLEVFEYEHGPLFFGREQEVCDLQIRLRQQDAAGCAFVLIVGASGSGKSSLARAGVAPAVSQYDREDDAAEWRRAVFTPGSNAADPLLGLAHALAAPHALPELAGENLAELAADLARDPELTFRRVLRPLFTGHGQPRRRLLLIFDQVEELFTHGEITAEAQNRLAAALGVLARSGHVWVLGTIRSDYYARFQAVPGLLALKGEGAHVDLPPPALTELQRIITQPARAAGLGFEENTKDEGLDARLLADAAAHPEALPLLEYCLDVLFQRQSERKDGVLRWADYETMQEWTAAALGGEAEAAAAGLSPHDGQTAETTEIGLAGALVSQAEAALGSLPAEHQRQCLNAVFGKLFDLSTGGRETPMRRTATEEELVRNPYAAPGSKEELPGASAFLAAFSARRLLVSGVTAATTTMDGGEPPQRTFTVAHEALLRNWWRLRRLQGEQAEFFRLRRQVERAHADWLTAKQDDSYLLAEGLPLQLARKLAAEAPELLTQGLADYIDRSEARVEQNQRRRRRLTAGVMAGLTLLALGAGVGAWFGFSGQQEARKRASEANRLATQARKTSSQDDLYVASIYRENDPRRALAHIARALRSDPENTTAEALGWNLAVRGGVVAPQFHPIHHPARINSASFSLDSRMIVTTSQDNTVHLWDIHLNKPLLIPFLLEKKYKIVRFDFQGFRVLTIDENDEIRVWDIDSGKAITSVMKNESPVTSANFSHNGSYIVTSTSYRGSYGSHPFGVKVWDISKEAIICEPLSEAENREGEVGSVDFSPDDAQVIVAANDMVYIFDTNTGNKIKEWQHPAFVTEAHFSPDGTWVITSCRDNFARIYDMRPGGLLPKLLKHPAEVTSANFSPDGLRIVTGSSDKALRIWDLPIGKDNPTFYSIWHSEAVAFTAFSPDGTKVVSICEDLTARIWDAHPFQPLYENYEKIDPDTRQDFNVFNFDGSQFLAGYSSTELRESLSGKLIDTFDDFACFSPNGSRILTMDGSGKTRILDCRTGDLMVKFDRSEQMHKAQFSHDGSRILTQSDDAIAVWSVSTGRQLAELKISNIDSVRFSPNGKSIITTFQKNNGIDDDHLAYIWDIHTGRPILNPLQHSAAVTSAKFSPDGSCIATTSEDHTARIWDARTHEQRFAPIQHRDAVNSIEFSSDSSLIATTSSETAHIWSTRSGKLISEPNRLQPGAVSAKFSPNNSLVVTGCGAKQDEPGYAEVWNIHSGVSLTGRLVQEAPVIWAEFSPDSSLVLTTCSGWSGGAEPYGHTQIWETMHGPMLVPEKVPNLFENIAGIRLKSGGLLEVADGGNISVIDQQFTDDYRSTYASWLFKDRDKRSISPSFTKTIPEYIEERFVFLLKDPQSSDYWAKEVYTVNPCHPIVHLALATFEKDATRAAFLRTYDLARLPAQDSALCARAAALLRAQQEPQLALQALEKALAAAPSPPPGGDLLTNLALTRWLCGDKDGAVRDGQRLLATDASYADAAKLPAVSALPEDDKAALLAALDETLRRHPELAPKAASGR